MDIFFLFFLSLSALYIANVISCTVIREVYEEAEIPTVFLFITPLLVVVLFFYFLFADQSKNFSRVRMAFLYLFMPAKNVSIMECLAEAYKERRRKIIYRPTWQRPYVPRVSVFANFMGVKVSDFYL